MSEKHTLINLDIKVNEEGLTIKDLLTTFLNELTKNGMFAAGVILSKSDRNVSQIFGHQAVDREKTFPIEVMKFVVDKFKPEMTVNIERIAGRQA